MGVRAFSRPPGSQIAPGVPCETLRSDAQPTEVKAPCQIARSSVSDVCVWPEKAIALD